MNKRIIEKDVLYKLYIEQDMTTEQIRKKLKAGSHTINRELNKHGLVELKKERNEKSQAHHRIYRIWQGMKTRCYNENDKSYSSYGAKGINIVDKWLEFDTFYSWSLENGYDKSLTIDRIDNGKGYSPENCRWASYSQQALNKSDSLKLFYNNELITVKEIAEKAGTLETTVRNRLARGWSVKRIIDTPTLEYGEVTTRKRGRKVKQYDLDMNLLNTYKSIRVASEKGGIGYHAISNCLQGNSKTSGGYIWRYAKGENYD